MNNELYYFKPYELDGVIYSCDMLYLKFRYNNDNLASFLQKELNFLNDDYDVNYYHSNDRYKYAHLFVVTFAKYNYKFIIKFELQGDNVGTLEFNPNHLMCDDAFRPFYFKIINSFYNLEYYKMDFAIDIPTNRCNVKVLRDNRKYMKFVQGSVTEYLGCRNKHNHVKIYDKSYESNLSYDLTRIEITFENNNIIKFPDIKVLYEQPTFSFSSMTPKEEFIFGLLIESEDPYFHLRKLKKRDREKYEDLLKSRYYDFELAAGAYIQVLYNMRDSFAFTVN